MKILTHILAVVLGAVMILVPVLRHNRSVGKYAAVAECTRMRQLVEKEIGDMSQQVQLQLGAFATAVAQDREFSMKLLVEKDAMAPEVAEIAGKYMAPMGFGVLEVCDSAFTVLSSGQFPARGGSSIAEKAASLGTEAVFVNEDFQGETALTLQAEAKFASVDIPFYCFGGIVIDNAMLARLSPGPKVNVLLKSGDRVMGMDSVVTISTVSDNRIIINNKRYIASSFPLSTAENETAAEIIVIIEEPALVSLKDIFKF